MNDYLKERKVGKGIYKILLLCSILFCSFTIVQAQTVTGIVKDANNEPIIGASVAVKGTTTGTLTDTEGNYKISAGSNSVLVFSFIGYTSKEVPVGSQKVIDVTLEESSQQLDEVVVTALGMSRDKKALGYAVTELKGDEISRTNSVSPVAALQGKVAGVQINMGSSGPQSSSRILIRGNSSLGKNNQPIFVIDGVIIDNDITDGVEWGPGMDFGNDLKNLNSDDFESVSVLKGAAATALYGSRAANGVVLITTKKGKQGEGLGISVSQSMMWDKAYSFPKYQNVFGPGVNSAWSLKADGSEDRTANDNGLNFGPKYDNLPYTHEGYETLYTARPNNVKQMYQTGNYSNTNVAIQGGDAKSSFRTSYSHLASEGITFNNSYKRNSFSINASREISKYVKAEGGVSWVQSDTKNPTYQGGNKSPLYDFMYRVNRDFDTKYWLQNYRNSKGDGYNSTDPYGYNGYLWDMLENEYRQKEDNIRGNLKFDFKITSWLTAKLSGDFNKLLTTRENKILALGNKNYEGAEYRLNQNRKDQYSLTAMLSATKNFGDFGLNGSAAVEQWDTRGSYSKGVTNGGLRVPGKFDITNTINPATQSSRSNYNRKRINSVYGFVNMDWKNQVYLDITGRNDWSSALMYPDGSGNVSYFYPSVSASWLATESLKGILPTAVSFAKLRASYAIVGNDTDPYATSKGYYMINEGYPVYTLGGTKINNPYYVFDTNVLPNPDLKPEKQHSIELGADIKFINNRLGIDITWYKTNTKNQILPINTAQETGMTDKLINAGNIQNSGFEIALSATPVESKDLKWDMTATFTRNKNKIVELAPNVPIFPIEYNGMDAHAYASVGGSYGDIYTDYAFKRNDKGEKVLNESGEWQRAGVRTKIGSLQPKFLASFSTTVQYKSIVLNVLLDARYGGDILSATYNYGMASGAIASSLNGRSEEYGGLARKLPDGRTVYDGMIPDGVFAEGITKNGQDVGGMSYREAYEKGLVGPIAAHQYYDNLYSWGTGIREASRFECSYVAVREISISWDIPRKWLQKVYVKNAAFSLVGRNLGYIYNSLPDNINPDVTSTNRSTQFVELGGSPLTRSLGFKLNIGF
ncbi:SusC/RagA family TonB-linked outer membrane protein [Dysgonomonas mossii]|uniref:SusC/RagA family TonB-linked outer membrane protein n=1 Tax=Dysgonomonas mossii TaxID=163665 RepID=UPI003993CC93